MSDNTQIQFHPTRYTDPVTGFEIERLTDPEITCHHMYFYAHMTTKDGRYLLMSAEVSGKRDIYLYELNTGIARRITQGEAVDDWGAEFSPDETSILYKEGQAIWTFDLESQERSKLYEAPAGWCARDINVARDSHYLVLVEIREDTMAAAIGGKNWDFFLQNCLAKPLCRLVRIDLSDGAREDLWEQHCWLGHPQQRPGDPTTLLFCHEGPYDAIDARMWLLNTVDKSVRCCREQDENTILTHEFWQADGARVIFVYRSMGADATEEIHAIDPATLAETCIMPCKTFAHCFCDAHGTLFVGDAQGDSTPIHLQDQNKVHVDDFTLDDYVYLVDPARATQTRLAYHGSSWSAKWGTPQDAHPHPCFSEDGRWVLFVTDRFGHPTIQRIDLSQIQADKS